MSEIGAFALERRYIAWWGRKDTKDDGILMNLTDGGDGVGGWVCQEETKQKIRKANTGKTPSEEALRKIRDNARQKKGKPRQIQEEHMEILKSPKSKEHKEKISASNKGKPKSEQHKEKMRKPRSPEAIANQVAAKKLKFSLLTEEEKLERRKRRKKQTPEEARISEEARKITRLKNKESGKIHGNTGKPKSEQHKEKMRKPRSPEAIAHSVNGKKKAKLIRESNELISSQL